MIYLTDFKAEPEELIQQQLQACERVIRAGWYILGSEVKNFEAEWGARCNAKYAVGVANGMDAIEIGLRTLGIGENDEVITTPMTAFATVLGILRAGATPVLADIDPNTALITPDSAERCLSSKTKAILLVHLYGQVRNLETWLDVCTSNHIYLVEDCAQSHLAMWNNKVSGSFGILGAHSFYPTKNLGAIGDGGALTTSDADIAKKAAILRNYGQSQRYHHPELGLNSRLDEIQAAILSVRLRWLEQFNQRRREIARLYFEQINNPYIDLLAPPISPENHVYHLFVVKSHVRDLFMSYLGENNITSLIHYPIPVHQQPPGQHLKCDPLGLPNAELHAQQCFSIPCHPQMSDNDVAKVIGVINEFRG